MARSATDGLQREPLSSFSHPPSQSKPVFGAGATMHPLLPGKKAVQTGQTPPAETNKLESVTFGDALQSIQRKRSASKSEGEGVKQPKVDNDALSAAPKNGKKEDDANLLSNTNSKKNSSGATTKDEEVSRIR